MLLKRMNASNMNRDKGTKRLVLSLEMLQNRISSLENDSAYGVVKMANSTEVPNWMLPILAKLPTENVDKSRISKVDTILNILSKARIPSRHHIQLK